MEKHLKRRFYFLRRVVYKQQHERTSSLVWQCSSRRIGPPLGLLGRTRAQGPMARREEVPRWPDFDVDGPGSVLSPREVCQLSVTRLRSKPGDYISQSFARCSWAVSSCDVSTQARPWNLGPHTIIADWTRSTLLEPPGEGRVRATPIFFLVI